MRGKSYENVNITFFPAKDQSDMTIGNINLKSQTFYDKRVKFNKFEQIFSNYFTNQNHAKEDVTVLLLKL